MPNGANSGTSLPPGSQAVFVAAAVAVVGAIVWLVLVAVGFSAFAKARNPTPEVANSRLPVATFAVAAAAASLGSAFLGPFVVLGQLVGVVLAGLALLRDPNPPSRVLARWVLTWAATLLAVVAIVSAITLSAYLLAATPHKLGKSTTS